MIDRGPWNGLVDDDGSNLVGSLWNKAAIKTVLLDPIDAETAWQTVPYVSTNFLSLGGDAWYVPAGNVIQKYSLKGKTATICVSITASHLYVASYYLGVAGWPFTLKPLQTTSYNPVITSHTPTAGVGVSLLTITGNYLDFRRINFSDWPTTGDDLFVNCSGTFEIT